MNTKGPLLYKITCEKPLLLNEEDLKNMYYRFINDPIRLGYIKEKQKLLECSVPFFVVNKTNNTIETKYDDETTKILNKIDSELTMYLTNTYGDYLSFTIKEER